MSTRTDIAEYLVSQLSGAGNVFARKMFGEYGLYLDGKVIALICDDQLYIKPTPAGLAFHPEADFGPPYPGAKDWLLIPEDLWDNAIWLQELAQITARALPEPNPQAHKKQRQK